MATLMVMPQMGYDMHEGKVVRWLKDEGEEVIRGEVIAEIETDKATVEYEAYTGGVMAKIVAEVGATIPVGELIAVITAPGEAIPEDILTDAAVAASADSPALATVETPAPTAEIAHSGGDGEVRASPLARRLAKERGVDLSTVNGTGPGGRITEVDIPEQGAPAAATNGFVRASPLAKRLARERGIDLTTLTGTGPGGRITEVDVPEHAAPVAAPATDDGAAPAALASETVELSRMRQAIARVTVDSKRDAPHFYVAVDVDMTKAMSFRRDLNDELDAE